MGAVKAGDGGVKFRAEWAEEDKANWTWMERGKGGRCDGTGC